MDLRKLEIFVSVAQHLSFSQAALALHMAQPAVSIAIRKLEDEFNTVLFERNNRTIQLTSEGQLALDKAKAILQQVNELSTSMSKLDGILRGELSIACPSMLGTYFFPDVLGAFLGEHTGLTASINQAGTQKIPNMILQDEVELGVINQTSYHPDLEVIPLVTQKIVLCVNEQHPLNQQKRVHIKQLHDVPMVLYQNDYFIRQQFDSQCLAHNIQPDIRMQSNFLPLLTSMVKNNFAATVGLEMMPQQEPGMVGLELSPKIELNMMLAWRKGRLISRANKVFIEWLKARG
ncbi:LysR family transcriptional regulator [Pseudomonas sp. HK3]